MLPMIVAALLNTLEQMIIERRRQISLKNFRHGSLAVKSAFHGRLYPNNFRRVVRFG